MSGARVLSWMRQGLGSKLQGSPASGRASVALEVVIAGAKRDQTLSLLGPGEVLGLDPSEVLGSSPVAGEAEFSPNLFPYIELRSADLPWRMSPKGLSDGRPEPWLTLVVVAAQAGVRLEPEGGPLPVLRLEAPCAPSAELPDLSESWAWVHVQVQEGVDISSADKALTALREDPSRFKARVVCPRRLSPRRAYVAALVPSTAAGVAAGLGLEPTPSEALRPAWDLSTAEARSALDGAGLALPVYASWRFSTGDAEDLEALLRRLAPAALPAQAGGRPVKGTLNPTQPAEIEFSFAGALIPPDSALEEPKASDLKEFRLTLQDAWAQTSSAEAPNAPWASDPLVAPPVYGATQADRLDEIPSLKTDADWLDELNLHPRHRTAAGVGAELVRKDQEPLMAWCWEQVESAREAEDGRRQQELSLALSGRLEQRLRRLSDERLVQLSAPSLRADQGFQSALREARVPAGLLSNALRRRSSLGSPLGRHLAAGKGSASTLARRALVDSALRKCTVTGTPAGMLSDDAALIGGTAAAKSRSTLDKSAGTTRFSAVAATSRIPVSAASSSTTTTQLSAAGASARNALNARDQALLRLEQRLVGVPRPSKGFPGPLRVELSLPLPLWQRVQALNPELILCGVQDLPQHSVSLAAVNAPMIEALLLGANHELSRELLWRELPVDLGQTPLACFWEAEEPELLLRPSAWRGALGTHLRSRAGLVLLLRSPVFERYPGLRLAVTPAKAGVSSQGLPVVDTRATPVPPDFEGELFPGLHFFGFMGLSVDAARSSGGAGGVFFTLEEAPTAPRFGLDMREADALPTTGDTDDLDWGDLPAAASGPGQSHLLLSAMPSARRSGWGPGRAWTWGRSSADMACILSQRPFRRHIHADRLLPARSPS